MTGHVPRPMRILHVIQNLNYGGMEKLMADLVRRIDHDRFESHVLALKYLGRYSREMESHATLHVGPPMSRLSLLRPQALARQLAALRPDLVHSHSGVWYKTARAARMAGVCRMVHTEHGQQPEGWVPRFLDRRAAGLTDTIVAVSRPLRAFMARRLDWPEERIDVVTNGVDTEVFRPRPSNGAIRSELGLGPGRPIVGSIGRLEPVKGYETVLEAFSLLLREERDRGAVLVIAGEGSARPELEALIDRLGLKGRVSLLGWRDDATQLYASFDCFVLGSWSEGTSVSLLEAMASGLAPVVTAVGGNPDVLGSELAAQAVPPGDASALANGIAQVIDREAARRIGQLARRRVEGAFSLDAMVRRYERLYEAAWVSPS